MPTQRGQIDSDLFSFIRKVMIMRYPNITKATFISRENRFVVTVLLNGEQIKVHVKNTGRCRELLVLGACVYLVKSDNPGRKYLYDLVAVEKGDRLINMDSQAPNVIFGEFLANGGLLQGITQIKPEFQFGNSRFDFYFSRGEERHLVEVKGVTLERDGVCRFPDAPTQRGTKHLRELIEATKHGYHSWVCFVIQMENAAVLCPNDDTDPSFGQALRDAADAGVHILAFSCRVIPGEVTVLREVPLDLTHS